MFLQKLKQFGGRALGSVGGVLSKIGSISQTAVRTLGSISSPLQGAISAIGSATGPEGAAVSGVINRGISALVGPKAQSITAGIGAAGNALSGLGSRMMGT